jgi:hypothetical protein
MFNLYFRIFDLAGLKFEPGFGELISPAGDATRSARVYRSKGVTGTRHQTQRSPFIDVTQAWYLVVGLADACQTAAPSTARIKARKNLMSRRSRGVE